MNYEVEIKTCTSGKATMEQIQEMIKKISAVLGENTTLSIEIKPVIIVRQSAENSK